MSTYGRDVDKTKCRSFLIKDEKLIEKYNQICKKVTNLSEKDLTATRYQWKTKMKFNIRNFNT